MRHEAKTLGEFLWKASMYARSGYTRYALRAIPEGKDLEAVDNKIMKAYDVTFCRMKRKRRRKEGRANVVYVRFKHEFLLLAEQGEHPEFDRIAGRDMAKVPLILSGYAVKIKNHRVSVTVSKKRWAVIAEMAQGMALHDKGKVERFIRGISPFTHRGILRQKFRLVRKINRRRKTAGLKQLCWEEIENNSLRQRLKRRKSRSKHS